MADLFKVAISGNLDAYTKGHERALAKAITQAVRGAAGVFRTRLRRQIARNFKDAKGLSRSLLKKNTPPTGYVLTPKSEVDPKAVYAAGTVGRKQDVDLLDLYTTAGTVKAAGHAWLAIPTKDAPLKGGRGGKRQATPAESGLKLVFLPTKDPNKAVLGVKHRGSGKMIIAYVLVKQTERAKRLDVDADFRVAGGMIETNFDRNWARESAALEAKY